MAVDNVKVIKIDTGEAQTSVKELKNQLKVLKDVMASTTQGTDEYNDALQQAAEITHTLKEQTEEINASAMDFGQIVGNVTKALGGIVAGFQAAKATMNLFGVENETVIKSLQKMQSLMAITQALPAIDNAIKGFRRLTMVIQASSTALQGFSKATIATGIGAIVAALGLLATNWDKVTDAMKRWGILNEDTKKKIEEQKKKVENLRDELAKLEGDYEQWEKDKKISKLNKDAKKSYEELGESIERYEQQLAKVVKQQEIVDTERPKGWKETWESLREEGIAIANNITLLKNQQDAILADANSYKELDTQTKNHTESVKTNTLWLEQQMNYFTRLREEMAKAKQELENLDESEEEDTAFLDKADDIRKKIEFTVRGLQHAFRTPEEQYQEEINALDVALKTKLIKEEEYNKLRDRLNKEQAQREIQRYAIAANSIGSIFSSLGDLMEDGSEEQKAFQIMGATINMLGGITAALSGVFTTHTGPWDIALAALQATSIAAGGAATIAKMAQTNDSNASSMASAAPSTAALGSLIAPVQYTQDVQGASIEGAIKDSKVYVVESDITNTQEKVNVSETEATY